MYVIDLPLVTVSVAQLMLAVLWSAKGSKEIMPTNVKLARNLQEDDES